MENVSKALIIAGAILLAILIIGLGMFVYTQASGVMDQINMDSQAVSAYNETFQQYEGTVSGAEAKSLYNAIRDHNRTNIDDYTRQITLTIGGTEFAADATQEVPTAAVTMPANTLKNGSTYGVTFAVDPNSGYITACNISEK